MSESESLAPSDVTATPAGREMQTKSKTNKHKRQKNKSFSMFAMCCLTHTRRCEPVPRLGLGLGLVCVGLSKVLSFDPFERFNKHHEPEAMTIVYYNWNSQVSDFSFTLLKHLDTNNHKMDRKIILFICLFFETGSHCLVWIGPRILMAQPLECCDYSHALSCPAGRLPFKENSFFGGGGEVHNSQMSYLNRNILLLQRVLFSREIPKMTCAVYLPQGKASNKQV